MATSKKKPLYMKVVDELRKEISKGVYEVGDLLPTEDELIKRFVMSRTTIRSAIGVLENEGFVVRKQGKGTIIKDKRIPQNYNYLSSFTETLAARGLTVETENISIGLLLPPESVKTALGIQEDTEVYLAQRTKVLDGKPICFMRNYLVAKHVPHLEKYVDELKTAGLYQLLEEKYRLSIDKAVDTITIYCCGPLESEILQLGKNIALFRNMRVTYLSSGEAFEYVISIIRGDIYEYKVYLKGRPSEKAYHFKEPPGED